MISSSSDTGSGRETIIHLSLIALVWIVMVVLVKPVGEFPLNDDWSFSWPVYHLIEKGTLEFSQWPFMTLVFQVYWGALFALPFGFSHLALRISTITMGLIGLFTFYALLRELKADRFTATFGTGVLMTSPYYLLLSTSFMSDIPFLTLVILSLLFLIRGVRRESWSGIIIGSLFGAAAVLVRQMAAALPAAFCFAYLVKALSERRSLKRALPIAFIPGVIAAAALILYELIYPPLFGATDLFAATGSHSRTAGGYFLPVFLANTTLYVLIYLGLFALPFTLPYAVKYWREAQPRSRRITASIWALCFILIMAALLVKGRLMPLTKNLLWDIGLGPPVLRDVYEMNLDNLPGLGWVGRLILSAVGAAGAALLLKILLSALAKLLKGFKTPRRWGENWLTILIAAASFLYFVPIAIQMQFFDRYILFFIPLALLLIVMTAGRNLSVATRPALFSGAAVMTLYTMFTVAAVRDYFSWNRARWEALEYITVEMKITPDRIDGGFEFNGWHCYREDYVRNRALKSQWWVVDDEYVVAFGQIPGYREIGRYPYERVLPPGEGSVLILHRTDRYTPGVKYPGAKYRDLYGN